jgi:cytochrome P450
MMVDYMGPSLDTTIFAVATAVWLFANNPDQWDLLREDPRLMSSAVNEVLRYDAPIQSFSRYVAHGCLRFKGYTDAGGRRNRATNG